MSQKSPVWNFRPTGELKENLHQFCDDESRKPAGALEYLTKLGLKAHEARLKQPELTLNK